MRAHARPSSRSRTTKRPGPLSAPANGRRECRLDNQLSAPPAGPMQRRGESAGSRREEPDRRDWIRGCDSRGESGGIARQNQARDACARIRACRSAKSEATARRPGALRHAGPRREDQRQQDDSGGRLVTPKVGQCVSPAPRSKLPDEKGQARRTALLWHQRPVSLDPQVIITRANGEKVAEGG